MNRSEKRQKMIEILTSGIFDRSNIPQLVEKCLELDNPEPELVKEIKDDMFSFYGFKLTDNQIIDYVDKSKIQIFDTLEREDYAEYLAKEITGMSWPMNMDTQAFKDKFYLSLRENAKEKGYEFIY